MILSNNLTTYLKKVLYSLMILKNSLLYLHLNLVFMVTEVALLNSTFVDWWSNPSKGCY